MNILKFKASSLANSDVFLVEGNRASIGRYVLCMFGEQASHAVFFRPFGFRSALCRMIEITSQKQHKYSQNSLHQHAYCGRATLLSYIVSLWLVYCGRVTVVVVEHIVYSYRKSSLPLARDASRRGLHCAPATPRAQGLSLSRQLGKRI